MWRVFHFTGKGKRSPYQVMTPRLTQPLPIAHADVPSREELEVFLERFCTFTNMEPPKSHMNELFPVLKRILVDVTVDPHRTSWLFPHGSTHKTIEAIMRLKDYTTMQTAKMVRYLLYVIFVFHISLFLTYSSWFFMKNCSQGPQFDEITLSFF